MSAPSHAPSPASTALAVALVAAACGPSVTPAAPPPAHPGTSAEAPLTEAPLTEAPPTERWTPRPDASFRRGPPDGMPDACGADVAAGIRALRLRGASRGPMTCDVRTYANGARRARVATVAYGEIMDCPSGCIQREASLIVLDGRVLRVPPARVNMVSPYFYLRNHLAEALPARGVPVTDPATGQAYDFFTETGDWCLNAYESEIALVTRGDAAWWSLRIPELVCNARGPHPEARSAGYAVVLSGEPVFPLDEDGPPVMDTHGLRLEVRATAPEP